MSELEDIGTTIFSVTTKSITQIGEEAIGPRLAEKAERISNYIHNDVELIGDV